MAVLFCFDDVLGETFQTVSVVRVVETRGFGRVGRCSRRSRFLRADREGRNKGKHKTKQTCCKG